MSDCPWRVPALVSYTLQIRAVETAFIAIDLPEPYKSALLAKADELTHLAAIAEHQRRSQGDRPDDAHLTYL